jgi:hypothetical protein
MSPFCQRIYKTLALKGRLQHDAFVGSVSSLQILCCLRLQYTLHLCNAMRVSGGSIEKRVFSRCRAVQVLPCIPSVEYQFRDGSGLLFHLEKNGLDEYSGAESFRRKNRVMCPTRGKRNVNHLVEMLLKYGLLTVYLPRRNGLCRSEGLPF